MTTRKIHKPWVKLHIRILYNADIGELPDSSKWRFIECLLLAGEERNRAAEENVDVEEGFLPSLKQMAYTLRTTQAALQDDLSRLSMSGLLELRQHPSGEDRWFVSNFEKWQTGDKSNPSAAERQRFSRNRRKNEEEEKEERDRVIVDTKMSQSRHNFVTEKSTPPPTVHYGQFDRTPGPGGKGYNLPENPPTFPPAAQLMHDLTDRYPGSVNSRYLAERLGDNPDREALAHVVKVWMARGYNMNNYEGMCDWYDERVKNPQWTPPTNGKKNAAGNNESAIEAIWRKALQAIDRGRVDDERLKAAIRAIGGSGAIKQANEFTTPKLKGRLFDEYQRVATAS